MPKTVLALYKHPMQARRAVTDLIGRGMHPDDISVVTAGTASGALTDIPLTAAELADTGRIGLRGPVADAVKAAGGSARRLAGILEGAGIPDPDSRLYSEGVRRGGTLVLATVPGNLADAAADALDAHSPEDPDEYAVPVAAAAEADTPAAEARAEPVPVEATVAQDARPAAAAAPPPLAAPVQDDEDRIQIVQEELEIGRRQVDRGGVVVSHHVSEVPVEEAVDLMEERVEVERRPADRVATEDEFRAFQPGEMVFTETSEEVVVDKVPYVVEEIVIRKTRQKRREVVRDRVRRSEVRIEPRKA